MRTAILDATRAILSERGYDGLTMRGVADRIEYSPAALYKHFTDREELVRELCARDFYAFNQMLLGRLVPPTRRDPLATLRAIGIAYAEFALAYPEQYRVMFMTTLPRQPVENEPAENAYAMVVAAVESAQALGAFPGLAPHLVAQTLWAAIHGAVSLEIVHLCVDDRKIPFMPIKERVATACDCSLAGMEAIARSTKRSRRHPTTRRVR